MQYQHERFRSLDIFRGLTICLMIIVNTTGNWSTTYPVLLHADWHGFTATDLVFPSFLFAVGNALAFVHRKWADKPFIKVFSKVFKRTIILFLLGYTMYWFPFMKWGADGQLAGFPISETRIMGVLQRIALCYFIASLLIYFLNIKQIIYTSMGLLLSYWAILYFGGDYEMVTNAGQFLDLAVLTESHLYHGEGVPFDPEGLLGTLPSTVNVLAGFVFGWYLLRDKLDYQFIAKSMVAGAICIFIAYFWNEVFPINKKIWTSSYVMHTVGLDLLIIGIIMFFVDMKKKFRAFNFFETFGKNPLFIYLLSEYLAISWLFIRVQGDQSLYSWIYENIFRMFGDYFGAFLFAFVFMLICWAFGKLLERKNIYIKV